MFSIVHVARMATGQTQTDFARNVGITQPDLCELEARFEPHGLIVKYQKISSYTGIPIDALLRNDFLQITDDFARRFPLPRYTPPPASTEARIGRIGEELIFSREKSRLSKTQPVLTRMVIPYFKLQAKAYPGYDILSFDDEGRPFALEVKTSELDLDAFRLSSNELAAAQKLTQAGDDYIISCVRSLGSDMQYIEDMSFVDVQEQYSIYPTHYQFRRRAPERQCTGLLYHRQRLGISQLELAQRMGATPCNLYKAETGQGHLIAKQYVNASDILGVPVDELLRSYSSRAWEAEYEH